MDPETLFRVLLDLDPPIHGHYELRVIRCNISNGRKLHMGWRMALMLNRRDREPERLYDSEGSTLTKAVERIISQVVERTERNLAASREQSSELEQRLAALRRYGSHDAQDMEGVA